MLTSKCRSYRPLSTGRCTKKQSATLILKFNLMCLPQLVPTTFVTSFPVPLNPDPIIRISGNQSSPVDLLKSSLYMVSE